MGNDIDTGLTFLAPTPVLEPQAGPDRKPGLKGLARYVRESILQLEMGDFVNGLADVMVDEVEKVNENMAPVLANRESRMTELMKMAEGGTLELQDAIQSLSTGLLPYPQAHQTLQDLLKGLDAKLAEDGEQGEEPIQEAIPQDVKDAIEAIRAKVGEAPEVAEKLKELALEVARAFKGGEPAPASESSLQTKPGEKLDEQETDTGARAEKDLEYAILAYGEYVKGLEGEELHHYVGSALEAAKEAGPEMPEEGLPAEEPAAEPAGGLPAEMDLGTLGGELEEPGEAEL